jgi:hypothetical protein
MLMLRLVCIRMAQGSCHSSDFSTAIPEEHLCLSVYVYVRVYNTHYPVICKNLWMLSIRNHMLTITVTVTVMVMVMVMVMVTVTATVMLN